ncbi:MAG TPA: hypothetical protein VES69_00360 [Pyrinomonadaceae bacterium]|nr:hypothetical protein [Pyrinomonadaceae bacterium]
MKRLLQWYKTAAAEFCSLFDRAVPVRTGSGSDLVSNWEAYNYNPVATARGSDRAIIKGFPKEGI